MIIWPAEIKKCKYRNWYEQLIKNSRNRVFPENTYTEGHHIIPRSLGGSNDPTNIVRLYPREHYIAHLLLWKMQMTAKMHNQMTMALHVMVNGSGNKKQNRTYLVPSRIYEVSRKAYSKVLSEERKGQGNSFYGKKHTPETIEKIKQANARTKEIRSAKLKGENNGMFGKKHSPEIRAKISEAFKANYTEEKREAASSRMKEQWKDSAYIEKHAQARLTSEGWLNRDWKAIGAKSAAGRIANGTNKMSPETRRKQSETRLAKIASGEIVPHNKGIPAPKYTCEHCGKIVGGKVNYLRHHHDNCKLKVLL